MWEYKIIYKDNYSKRMKTRNKKGFHSQKEAESAAVEMCGFLRHRID